MSIKQIIPADHYKHRKVFKKDGENFLNVSEFYYDTIQGEGKYTGHPAAFLRLKGCVMNCSYCDTREVWTNGTSYTYDELFALINNSDLVSRLERGQHLVITGGSPLLQQDKIVEFMNRFIDNYDLIPFIEIENECVIMPGSGLIATVECWNNSPKLSNSGVPFFSRYKPDVISAMAQLDKSWFKFVISDEFEWEEIDVYFLKQRLIGEDQIILMPKGETKAELDITRPKVLDVAVANGVTFTDRLQITVWDKKTGT